MKFVKLMIYKSIKKLTKSGNNRLHLSCLRDVIKDGKIMLGLITLIVPCQFNWVGCI